MSWTEERVARLTKLWTDGLSAAQVAAELGGVTRNAVIGKVHRLGLSGRTKQPSKGGGRPKRTARTNAYPKNRAANRATRTNSANRAKTIDQNAAAVADIKAPEPKRYKLVQLTETTCRWPIGDPQEADFCFCANKIKADTPYCEYHCSLAYQPVAERRRVRKPAMAIR